MPADRLSIAEYLRRITPDAGLGFCYQSSTDLFSGEQGCGPLLVVLDSNTVIDLQDHGAAIVNGDRLEGVDDEYADELEALGAIIDLWMTRDIRFLSLKRADDDSKRDPGSARADQRRGSILNLNQALTFQLQDWEGQNDRWESREPNSLPLFELDPLEEFPAGADRDLINEALAARAHVFLTRDKAVLRAGRERQDLRLLVASPVDLWLALAELDVGAIAGGTANHPDCPYSGPRLMPDMGRIAALMAITDNSRYFW